MNLQPGFVPMFRPVAVPLVRVAVPIHPGMAHPPPPPPGQAHFFPGAPIGPPPAPPPNQPTQSPTTHGLPPGLLALGTSQPGVQGGTVSLVSSQSMQHASPSPLMSIGLLGQAPQMTQAALQSSLQSQALLAGLPPAPPTGAAPSPGIPVGQLTGQFANRAAYPDDSQRNSANSGVVPAAKVEEEPPQDGGMAMLDHFNSDLNLTIDQDGYGGKAMTKPRGFCFCWAGARSTYGVNKGKAYFEVHISEYLSVDFGTDHQETDPHVVRVGWSVDAASMQLGEDPWSYGYGGTGKLSANSKFSNYGEKFMAGDVIGALLDLESRPPTISYSKNGNWLGVAVPLHNFPVGQPDIALFPHILSKNCGFKINFGQMAPWYPPPQGYAYIDQLPLSYKVHGMQPPARKSDSEMIMIIGLPGAGKTTYGINMQKGHPEKRYNIIGTDTLIDKMRVMGLPRRRNYHGRWDVLIDKATKCLNTLFQIASKRNRNYILDQTNVYPSAQRRKMGYFQGFYRKAAVLVPEDKELIRRSIKRTEEDGKFVPEEAVLEMKKNFQLPDPNSSLFDEINFVELPQEVASGLVIQYNQEAREKLSSRGRTFDRFSGNQPFQPPEPPPLPPQQYGRGVSPGVQGQQFQNWQSDTRSTYSQPPPPPPAMPNDWPPMGEKHGRKREVNDHSMENRKRSRSDQGGASALDFIKQEYAEEDVVDPAGVWQGMKVKEEPKFWDQFSGQRVNDPSSGQRQSAEFANLRQSDQFANQRRSDPFANQQQSDPFASQRQSDPFASQRQNDQFGNQRQNDQFSSQRQSDQFGNQQQHDQFSNQRQSDPFGGQRQSDQFGNQRQSDPFGSQRQGDQFGNQRQSDPFGGQRQSDQFGNQRQNDQYSNERQGDQSQGHSRFQQNPSSDHRRRHQAPGMKSDSSRSQMGEDSFNRQPGGFDGGFGSFGQQDSFRQDSPSHRDSWRKDKNQDYRDNESAGYGSNRHDRKEDGDHFRGNSFNANKSMDRKPFPPGNWNDNFNNSGAASDTKVNQLLPGYRDSSQERFGQSGTPEPKPPRSYSDFGNSQDSSPGFSSASHQNSAPQPPFQASNRRHFSIDDSGTGQTSGRTRQRKSKWDTPSDSPEPNPEAQLPDFQSADPSNVPPRELPAQMPSSQEDYGAPQDKEPNWGSAGQGASWPPKPQPLLQMDLPDMHSKFGRFSDSPDSGNAQKDSSRNQGPHQRPGWRQGQESERDFNAEEEFDNGNGSEHGGPAGPGRMRGSGRGFGMGRGGPRFPNRSPGNPPRFGPPRGGGPRNFGPRNPSFGGPRGGWNQGPRGPRGFEGRGGGPRNFPPRFGGPRMGGPRFPRMPGQQRWPRP